MLHTVIQTINKPKRDALLSAVTAVQNRLVIKSLLSTAIAIQKSCQETFVSLLHISTCNKSSNSSEGAEDSCRSVCKKLYRIPLPCLYCRSNNNKAAEQHVDPD